jgi:hypothetical protein
MVAFSLGLTAKPMLVSLPFIMLLMDHWPLGRVTGFGGKDPVPVHRLLLEKIPFLVLAAASCGITVIAQSGAMTSLVVSSLANRIANSLISYVMYLAKTFWPVNLSPFYPFPDSIPIWQTAAAALILAVISLTAFRERIRRPYLLVGWFWFLISLAPVIGIVRVGMHAYADRYTYVPHIGLFVLLVWGTADLWHFRWADRKPLTAATIVILAALSLITWRQTSFWKDSATLFSHAHAVTENNHVASNILAIDSMKRGDHERALRLFDRSIREAPWFNEPYIEQGAALYRLGRLEEAEQQYRHVLILNHTRSDVHNNLGVILAERGRFDEARDHFRKALQIRPDYRDAQQNLKLARELQSGDSQQIPDTQEKRH